MEILKNKPCIKCGNKFHKPLSADDNCIYVCTMCGKEIVPLGQSAIPSPQALTLPTGEGQGGRYERTIK
jgi:DNA-directed RNA polymerase subunit RPC12/RpoP